MLYHYAGILDRCEPFLIAHPGALALLDRAPLGVAIPPERVYDPQRRGNAVLLGLLRRLDALTFGPYGMTMPPWVFYDCAVMPGAFFGLGMPRAHLEPWALRALEVPDDYDGLVPVSQFIAIPTMEPAAEAATAGPLDAPAGGPAGAPGSWLLYSLESINQVAPGFAPAGVLSLTLALGLQVFPLRRLYGVTQWRSPKLETYVKLGPIELVTAFTPAHSLPRTLTFRIERALFSPSLVLASPRHHPLAPPPTELLDPDDVGALAALQARIEGGDRVSVVGPPERRGSRLRVPLAVVPAEVAR